MAGSIKVKAKKKAGKALIKVTRWHFEDRMKRNRDIPSYGKVSSDSDWHKLSAVETVYHDNGDKFPEEKYVNYDGREAVFDGKTKRLVTDERYIGTYNYVTPYVLPEKGERKKGDFTKWFYTRIGHAFMDVAPYYLTFKSNTRRQYEVAIGFQK